MASPSDDIESRLYYLCGYPSLAAFIASDRDRTTAIFKRFDDLAVRNLLYYQCELAELQEQQRRFDQEDLRADMETKQCARNWKDFKRAASQNGNTKQKERMELMLKIRSTMKEYREALLFESTLASVKPPAKRTLEAFRFGFFNGKPGSDKSFPTLGGSGAALYDNREDLLALRMPESDDRLTNFARDHLGCLFPDRHRPSSSSIAYSSDRSMQTFITYFSTLLAALLLIGAIIILYNVTIPKWRIALIGIFTTLFAASVGLLTTARRAEVFAATAAYAAVLVVFVSSNLDSGGNSKKIDS